MADVHFAVQLAGSPTDQTEDFKDSLIPLFDHMLNDAGITDSDTLNKIARLRAKVDIELKQF